MVQVEGSPKMIPSCSTTARDKMKIVTDSPEILEYRKALLTLIMKNHGDHQDGKEDKCSLHALAKKYSVTRVPEVELVSKIDRSHPALDFDPGLCIKCRKCLVACVDEQSNDVIGLSGKGQNLKVIFDSGEDLGSSSCVSCGACADVCPSGALIERDWKKADRTVESTCPYCAVGCTIEYGIRGNSIVWARGVKENSVNEGKLCVKGKFGFEFESSKDRLLYPLVRKDGFKREPLNGRKVEEVFRRASWDEALDIVSNKIISVKAEYGINSIAGIACDRATNEDVYAFQKFMRAVIGTDNVDQSATLCHSPSARMLAWGLGAGSSTNPISDVINSKTIMVVGSNTDRAHPVASSFIKKAAKKGAHLIVVDPRKVELAEKANTFLQIKPGSDTYLFSVMARYIVENNLYDPEYVKNHTEGFDEFIDSLKVFDPASAEKITGIKREEIEGVARLYAENKPSSIYWTLGITEHINGSDNVSSLVNLAILTGNIGIPGGGLNPLRGQNNVQGAADVGGSPGSLPGYQSLLDPAIRNKFESNWKVSLPGEIGWKSTEMIEKANSGKLKLMYITGENSIRSHPNSTEVENAFQALDFLIVQDIFLTETAEFADVILPAASSFEKTGTFTNTERRIQMVRQLFSPPGEAKADWEIYTELSRKIGLDLSYTDSSEIMDEIAELVPAWKGVSHSRLENGGLSWPVPSFDSSGTSILHIGNAMRGKAKFRALGWNREEDAKYPYVLITGRKREHYHTATMTSRSGVINRITEGPFLEMSLGDMRRENLVNGDTVEVESSSGKITCRVKGSENLTSGVTFTTFHFPELPVNILTPSTLDPFTKTPAFKDTRIKVRKIMN